MIKYVKELFSISIMVLGLIYAFVIDSVWVKIPLFLESPDYNRVMIFKILTAVIVVIIILSIQAFRIYIQYRSNHILLKNKNYVIEIKYGDILEENNCKRVISFDECFTTKIGENPEDIRIGSICGQYLQKNNNLDIKGLIKKYDIKSSSKPSKYKKQVCYIPGTIIPNEDDLLMAFTKLDSNGLGVMSYDEYMNCLNLLWKEINKYHGEKNVCIPILGSYIVRFKDVQLTQQELLDIIIGSYKLSKYKLNNSFKLIICCKKRKDFSIHKVNN